MSAAQRQAFADGYRDGLYADQAQDKELGYNPPANAHYRTYNRAYDRGMNRRIERAQRTEEAIQQIEALLR